MSELFHLGLATADVQDVAVVVEAGSAPAQWPADWTVTQRARRREFRSVSVQFGDVGGLVSDGAFGAPAAAIAVEELMRAGARRLISVAACRCAGCAGAEPVHPLVLVAGAARGEATTDQYAPSGFPAVPDPGLLWALTDEFPDASTQVISTVDVLPAWAPRTRPGFRPECPIDLMSSAVLIAASAAGVPAAALLVASSASDEQRHRVIAGSVRAAASLAYVGARDGAR